MIFMENPYHIPNYRIEDASIPHPSVVDTELFCILSYKTTQCTHCAIQCYKGGCPNAFRA